MKKKCGIYNLQVFCDILKLCYFVIRKKNGRLIRFDIELDE